MLQKTKKTYPRRYHPMLVSNSGTDERMDGKSSLILWEAFDRLPEETKRRVSADEVAERTQAIQNNFHLSDSLIGKITLLIRQLFFGEINNSFLIAKITNILADNGTVSSANVESLAKFIKDEILNIKLISREDSEQQAIKTRTENIPLTDALLKYPKIAEQNITNDPIKLRYFPEPVRPSLKNWMTDFHDSMGSMTHSPIDRGNFLFHSENGKKLSAVERQRLGTVLKSLDEKTLVNVNVETQQVVFDNNAESQSSVLPQAYPRDISHQSSNQVGSVDRGGDDIALIQVQKNVLPNIDLRANPEQNIKKSNTNTAFSLGGNENHVNNVQANHPVQPMRQEERVQDFFAKPATEGVSRILSKQNAAMETLVAPAPVIQEQKVAENKENYFSIPGSKPQIGSESFHIKSTDELHVANIGSSQTSLPSGHLSSSEERMTEKKAFDDPNLMSDEMLYRMIQEKKIKKAALNQGTNIASGKMVFSSPQKLPAEQSMKQNQIPVAKPAQPQQSQSSIGANPIHKPVAAQNQGSPYHIVPSRHAQKETDVFPKIQKNIVDLKN